jgi:peptidoglycan hydrolase-like protein with peptidoglycan-binding domain
MYVFEEGISGLADWIQDELDLDGRLMVGASGLAVRRVQEWLSLRGYGLAIDGIYGPITSEVVARFQEDSFLEATGQVNEETFARLTELM